MSQDNWKQAAENIYNDYTKKKIINSAYQDAVIAFLWLIARLMIERETRQDAIANAVTGRKPKK